MSTQTEVVYPSTASWATTGQLDLGPYEVPDVVTLLRAEVRGAMNLQARLFGASSVNANFPLWAVQWVAHGSPPANIVTTADGPNWLIREQLGKTDTMAPWAPDSDNANIMACWATVADWAGQLPIGASIDLYLSFRPPTGSATGNANYFGSLRFWWA